MQTLYSIALTTHITGLCMMAGTTLTDYVLTRQFWKQYANDKMKGLAIYESMSKLAILFGMGMVLLVVSGITMMGLTHGVFGEQTWFRIKLGLVAIIIVNGIANGRRQGIKLGKILSAGIAGNYAQAGLTKIKSSLSLFHVSQLILFIIVFVLSVFKFN